MRRHNHTLHYKKMHERDVGLETRLSNICNIIYCLKFMLEHYSKIDVLCGSYFDAFVLCSFIPLLFDCVIKKINHFCNGLPYFFISVYIKRNMVKISLHAEYLSQT